MTITSISLIAAVGFAVVAAPQLAQAQQTGISITSGTTILASKQEVMDYLRFLERYPTWSPFLVADPEQKHHVTGTDGQVGATFHWEGVAEKSLGAQEIVWIEGQDSIKMACHIMKPFKGHSSFSYQLIEREGAVEVVQHFHLPAKGFTRFMLRLFGVEKQMAETNQLGMDRLKAAVEGQAYTQG